MFLVSNQEHELFTQALQEAKSLVNQNPQNQVKIINIQNNFCFNLDGKRINQTLEEYCKTNQNNPVAEDNFEILIGLMFAFGDHEYTIQGYSNESENIKINCLNEKNQTTDFEYQEIAQLALIN